MNWRGLLLFRCLFLFVNSGGNHLSTSSRRAGGHSQRGSQGAGPLHVSPGRESWRFRTGKPGATELSSCRLVAEGVRTPPRGVVGRGFKELPGANLSEQSASGTFEGAASSSRSACTPGRESGPGEREPDPARKRRYQQASCPARLGSRFSTVRSVPCTSPSPASRRPDRTAASSCSPRDGRPYGEAGPSLFFRQNAIRLTAFITAAPAQGNRPC